MIHVFEGEGPGTQTSDGCSVELYRDLPYLGELDDILGELRNGSHILELGCGTGRLTRQLVGQGLSVTGVDNSAEMLAGMPREAAAVLCEIEQLSLVDRFDRRNPRELSQMVEKTSAGDIWFAAKSAGVDAAQAAALSAWQGKTTPERAELTLQRGDAVLR